MDKFLVARRSIYDKKIAVQGYQLMFQDADDPEDETAGIPDSLTCEDLGAAFNNESMRQLFGDGLVFVSFSPSMLNEEIPSKVPKAQLVIHIDASQLNLDAALTDKLRALAKPYKVAITGLSSLDDLNEFLEFATFIGLDVGATNETKIAELVEKLKQSKVKLLAYNIQTHKAFDQCKALGFDYYSGYFLDLPNLDSGQKVSSNRLTTMRLLVSLDDPDISIETVEELISQDARLGYRLLKAVNSAAYGLPRTVSSLREAVVFLGLKQIRSWCSMVIITCQDEKPSDLLLTTMIRARMCELMAEQIGADDSKAYFTVGLFSTLDAILDRKLDELVAELNLSDDLQEALLEHDGELGAMLQNVIAYGHGQWAELADSGIDMDVWRDAYMESVSWANNSFKQLNSKD